MSSSLLADGLVIEYSPRQERQSMLESRSYRFGLAVMVSPRKRRLFYGYHIVAVTFLFMLLVNGFGVYAFGLFVKPLEESLGWRRGQVMVGFTVFYALMAIASPIVGRFLDRYGARAVIPFGAVLMCLGFLLLSTTNSIHTFYAGYAIVGAGAATMGPVPCSAVISNWFKRRRGTALGLMSAGYGAGGVVMAPLVGQLLSNFDWRTTYLSIALLIVGVTVPLSLAAIRSRPEEMGLLPDGDSAPTGDASDEAHGGDKVLGLTLRQSLSTASFWLVAATFFFSSFAHMGTIQSLAPFLEDTGYPTAMAASALGAIGLGSGAGKIFFGWLCDRIRANRACAIGIALQLAAVLLLLKVHPGSSIIFVATCAIVLGFGMGAWLPTLSMLTSTIFGLPFYGAVFGALYLCQGIGAAGGPLFSGLVHDVTASYSGVFASYLVLLAMAIPTVLFLRKPSLSARS